MLVAAITMIAATGCQEDWEDTFSTEPTAPELVNNGAIWMTQNTMSENVIWAWSSARFMQGVVTYSLYAQYGESIMQVGPSTNELTINVTKEEFHKILTSFVGSPANGSFDLNFYVEAADATDKYQSTKQTVKVHAYVDAVSPTTTTTVSEIVLDMTTPTAELELLSWEPARLAYGEDITYNVTMKYGEGTPVNVATDLTTTTCVKTVDEWNELVVSSGAPEAKASDVELTVTAYSESYPEGISASPVVVNITTYVANYPECMYLPGSYQSWTPATAITIKQSTTTKGLYAAYVDLTTADGSDVEFKFCPEPAWGNDFGSDEFTVSTDKGFAIGTGASIGSANIKVPSGLYHITLNKKFNTIEMVQINQMGMIGGFNGWGSDLVMDYDAETNTYSATGTFEQGVEYKFRANGDWTYAIGADGLLATSADNCVFEKETGEYKVVLDVNRHPYSIKYLSTSYPEQLYLPGSHQGWAPASAPILQGNGEGQFEGAVNLVDNSGAADCQFKFSPVPRWEGDFGGTYTEEKGLYQGTYGVPDNIVVPSGYYYMWVDMTAGSFTLLPITGVGLIGDFNSWGGDEALTYDATTNVWTVTANLVAGQGFKVRFNGGWDYNRGAGGDVEPYVLPIGSSIPAYNNGKNLTVPEDGTYTITLDMSTNPNTITLSK